MYINPHTAVDMGISGSSISHTFVESSLWLGYRCGNPYVTTSSSSLRYDKYSSSSSVSKSLAGSVYREKKREALLIVIIIEY